MDPMSFSGSVSTARGVRVPVRAVNDVLDPSGTVIYNARWGRGTRTDRGTWEAVLRTVDKPAINGMARFVIDRVETEGNTSLSSGMWVWSSVTAGTADIRKGDTVLVSLQVWENEGTLDEIVGGGGRILREGHTVDNDEHRREGIGIKFTTDRHPRTFVGMSKDSTVLFLGTVDGRQSSSIGMDFREMARFLRSIGAWNAVNLDGGGSTTMVVEGTIVNSPSDRTGERAVANTIMIIQKR